MATFKTLSGKTSCELLSAEDFLKHDAAKKTRKAGLYVRGKDHAAEVNMGKVFEARYGGTVQCFYPPDDEAPFDIALVRTADWVVIATAEFKQRTYSSIKKFTYGPEVQKVAKIVPLAQEWGVQAFFLARWTDGVIHHAVLTKDFHEKHKNKVGTLFNAQPNRPGETPDAIYHLKPEEFGTSLTPFGAAVFGK
jgi:hypothetical protein